MYRLPSFTPVELDERYAASAPTRTLLGRIRAVEFAESKPFAACPDTDMVEAELSVPAKVTPVELPTALPPAALPKYTEVGKITPVLLYVKLDEPTSMRRLAK